MIFPSPTKTDERYGIGWHPVAGGVFDDGLDVTEAEVVANAAIDFLRTHPSRSLGVVAMNLKQAERIRDLVDEWSRDDPALVARAEDYEKQTEPFFVKNLENVQGDERDVMMISMTYGPATPGKGVVQRFGPINNPDGWRRLNVLFTRAKERMEVFSSMRAGDILVGNNSSRGVSALHDFLDYVETGRLNSQFTSGGGRPPDSDFEVEVLNGLQRRGYRCDYQIGASGYYIDLAVVDPEQPGRYLLGIECDGATYHSSASARDRDRLRQDILEDKLGWVIERVWSTDWFQNPEAELDRLQRRIEELWARSKLERRVEVSSVIAETPDEPVDASVQVVDQKADHARPQDLKTVAPPPSAVDAPAVPQRLTTLFDLPPSSQRRPAAGETIRAGHEAHGKVAPRVEPPPVKPRPLRPLALSPDNARRKLVELRETEIKPAFPNSDPARGLLRKSMLEALIRARPTTMAEFRNLPQKLREDTDPDQLHAFANKVFEILDEIEVPA